MAVSRKDTLPPVHPSAVPAAGVVHLGLRYNLVLFKNGKPEAAPADRILHAGDCFSIEFQANRSGYLYVLAKQSSGTWIPLLPSAEMPDENNILDPDKKIQIPKSYCFEIHDPPGAETLFVVLSRNPRDFYELYQGIKAKNTSAAPVQVAVAQLNDRFGSREIAVRKVDNPVSAGEPKSAVYVVNASNKPASSIVTEINVVHH